MIIGSDLSWLNGASRSGDPRFVSDRSATRVDGPAGSATAADSQAALSQIQRVAATQSARSQNEAGARNPQERENDARRFAREAPNGERPRYIPKGQRLNVLV